MNEAMNERVLAGYLARADEWEAQGAKYAAATVRDLVKEVRRLNLMVDRVLRELDRKLSTCATCGGLGTVGKLEMDLRICPDCGGTEAAFDAVVDAKYPPR